MTRLEVESTTEDELRRQIERSVQNAFESQMEEVRESIDRFNRTVCLHKTWLTLEEAAQDADLTTTTLREWRDNGLPESEVEGRNDVKREDLDALIESHKKE